MRRPLNYCRFAGCTELHRNRHGYCELHKSYAKAWNRRINRTLYPRNWTTIRQRVLERDNFLCQECKKNHRFVTGSEVDHIIPLCKNGSHALSNLQTLCKSCHRKKTRSEFNLSKQCKKDSEFLL